MELDNTWYFQPSPYGMGGPRFGSGMAGLSAFDSGNVQTQADPIQIGDTTISQSAITAANAEAYYLTNLVRGWGGLAPLPQQGYAPSVNVGLAPETTQLLLFGGIGIAAVLMLRKKRGKRR